MPTILPPWPHLLFGVLEPISLVLGSLAPLVDVESFISGQTFQATPPVAHPSSVSLAYQVGNLYSLLCLVGVAVLHTTTEPQVVRNYLIALAIADVGHVCATYMGLGWAAFVDYSAWNALTWGNIGATAFLFVNRLAYFTGIFGTAKVPKAEGKQE
ncbi:hypothetical protein N7539_007724 [Penicillium diatomitis]|uniref:DUF7704 domain-containing protein n=1 Tax=Penicillium diatomitis TaxID=2819901 RepID=A0A9X0BNP3_9EURO|nr:uncharacterized protein N7539_007724 [Penicillium diatomitis]KAJ5475437.1 hypothetical protein N7539_007724 [Penicillium diatomitis]